jgi:hypothetical protein
MHVCLLGRRLTVARCDRAPNSVLCYTPFRQNFPEHRCVLPKLTDASETVDGNLNLRLGDGVDGGSLRIIAQWGRV